MEKSHKKVLNKNFFFIIYKNAGTGIKNWLWNIIIFGGMEKEKKTWLRDQEYATKVFDAITT